MEYRTHEHSPLTSIRIAPGAVIVSMKFDMPGCYVKLHSHSFDHWMHVIRGTVLISIDGAVSIKHAGEKYFVAAHKQHDVTPLSIDAEVECVHEHDDIHPDKTDGGDGIPIEWLRRLTDTVDA